MTHGVAVIGAGYGGVRHALAWSAVAATFGGVAREFARQPEDFAPADEAGARGFRTVLVATE